MAPPMTEQQLAWISEATRRAVEKAVRKYRNGALVGFLVLLFGLGFVLHQQSVQGVKRSSVLCALLVRADRQTYLFERDGTITQAQLDRALKNSAEARGELGPAPNCSTDITPPPPEDQLPFDPKPSG